MKSPQDSTENIDEKINAFQNHCTEFLKVLFPGDQLHDDIKILFS
jgi:hypothetical protein